MLKRWLLLFVALVPPLVMWSLANPMFASPDETVHMARAQGFSNFDFSSPYRTDGLPIASVECYRFNSEITAACQDLTWGEPGTEIASSARGYPPLFHAIAAVPAFASSGLFGAYLMRIWMVVVCSAILAWAGTLLTRAGRGPWLVVGVLLAISPMVGFSIATVSPSGLAATFALLFVAGVLGSYGSVGVADAWRQRTLVGSIAVGAAGLSTVRRDGLIWLIILCIVLSPLLPWRRLASQLRTAPRQPVAAAAAGSAVFLSIVAYVWVLPTVERFARNWSDGMGGQTWNAARTIQAYFRQLIGTFGWLDSPVNDEVFLVAVALLGFVIVLGLVTGTRRLVTSTALALTALIVTPAAFGTIRFPYLQGRYLIPIFVCLVMVAAMAVASGDLSRRASWRAGRLVLVVWAGVHVLAYIQNLRRYAVGRTGTWAFITDHEWSPPMMSNLAAVFLFMLAMAGTVVAVTALLRDLASDESPEVPVSGGGVGVDHSHCDEVVDVESADVAITGAIT